MEDINGIHRKSSYTHLGKIRNTNKGVKVIQIGIVKVCCEHSEEDDVYFDFDVGKMVVSSSSGIEPNCQGRPEHIEGISSTFAFFDIKILECSILNRWQARSVKLAQERSYDVTVVF